MSQYYCIYHGNCPDGFTSAWVIKRSLRDSVEFFAGTYQKDPPYDELKNKNVILVDFSYKKEVLEKIRDLAKSVLILDHHKTAEDDLKDIFGVTKVFDMSRSGCRIAWDYCFPTEAPPLALLHVEDRDLWKWKLPNTRAITTAIFSYDYTFENWDMIMNSDLSELQHQGEILEKKFNKDLNEIIGITKRRMLIGGYNVPVANMPHIYASEGGNKLAKGEPFSAIYYLTSDGVVFSLRSDYGVDVSEIAKMYGGGGHRNASGFKVSYDKFLEFHIKE